MIDGSTFGKQTDQPPPRSLNIRLHAAEVAALEYHATAKRVCRDCAAKDAVIQGLSERVTKMAAHLAMLAERERKRGEPWPPPEMIEP